MTTIACDGNSIAGDSRITGNGTIHDDDCCKVFTLKDGRVVGFSGQAYFHEQAIAFLEGDRPEVDFGDEFEAIILSPSGECRCMDGKGRSYRQSVPCVTGSGGSFALAAMRLGKSARQAVELAMTLDPYTGGEITVAYPRPVLAASHAA